MNEPTAPTEGLSKCPVCHAGKPAGKAVCSNCGSTRTIGGDDDRATLAGLKQIAGYKVLRELGAGGMGTVFEAVDEKMDRHVALKVLSRHHATSTKAGLRFEQEAWIAGKLDHPNLVKVYERGEWEELSYYSMELAEGGSLDDVIRNMKLLGRDDSLGLDFGTREYIHWAIHQVITVARGLEYAHQHGVVHRDIKPMNLLLSKSRDTIKIADFGLAIEEAATRLTTVGRVLGTLAFMAPEQVLGKSEDIDARTDVYALGVTLFQLLTLKLPFSGKTQQLYMDAVLTHEARRPSKFNQQVSRDLETVVRKALEKKRRDRYQSAAALADDLDNVTHLRPIGARPVAWWTTLGKWILRKPVHAMLLATLVLGSPVIGVLAVREVQHRQARRAERIEDLLQEARWLEERQRHAEVRAIASRILSLDPDQPMGLWHRALSQMFLSLTAEDPGETSSLIRNALKDADRIIALEPEQSWPHVLKAFMFRNWERMDEAAEEEALAAELADDTLDDTELDLRARLAMDEERYEDAIELLSTLILRRPEDAAAIASRGYAYDELGDDATAYNEYRLAIGLNKELDLTYIDLARLSKLQGKHDEAHSYLARSLELNPDGAHAHEAMAMNHVDRGTQALVHGKAGDAESLFGQGEASARRSIELNPGRPWAYLNLGASLSGQGRLDGSDPGTIEAAVEAYERALAVMREPGQRRDAEVHSSALQNICDARIELGQLELARSACLEAAKASPDDPVAHYNLAGVYSLLGQPEQALASLERDFALGDTDWEYLAQDHWFESLRDDRRFVDLIERLKQAAE